MEHLFGYRWRLADADFTKDKGKVFSCFACGGGSTMGYKLAGFDVIGCNEIDPRMNECYVANHHPKYNFLCDIRDMVKADDLPAELYQLDVLDGSPPCSTFSMAGSREDAWGVERRFKEGQKEQVLDTLFFDFIALAKKLQPKVVIAENVKGILLGNASKYMAEIYRQLDEAGYYVQHFVLDASTMGVPQKRERVFFVCLRKDLAEPVLYQANMFEMLPYIDMEFCEKPIKFGEFADYKGKSIGNGKIREYWENRQPSDDSLADVTLRMYGKEKCFNLRLDKENEVCHTYPADNVLITYKHPVYHSDTEVKCISTFPMDYDFKKQRAGYLCGMSVPPVMMAQVATRVYKYWLSNI